MSSLTAWGKKLFWALVVQYDNIIQLIVFHHRNCPLHPMYDIFLVLVLLLSLVMFSLSSCSYLEKFTDFLRLFVSVHLRRIESSPQFPIVEFLALLFKYTFNQVIIIWLNSHLFMQCTPKVVHFYTFFCKIWVLRDYITSSLWVSAYPRRLLCLFGYMECLFGFSNNQNQKQTCWQRKCSK